MTPRCRARAILFSLLASALPACTDSTTVTDAPTQVVVAAGDAQEGSPDALLPLPVEFRVVDAAGHPVANVPVDLVLVDGAGAVPAMQLKTNENGIVTVPWTIGASPVTQRLEARVGTLAPARVTATTCAPGDCVRGPLDEVRLLPIGTYDGSNQVVHPDVAVGSGLGAAYWLAITPYPNGNASLENPSIFNGSNGVSWTPPPGLSNPVERPATGSYLSDPDLLFDDSSRQLWLFYRTVTTTGNAVLVTRSSDGIHWGRAIEVANAPSHEIVSPTVVRAAPQAAWVMWAVNSGAAGCSARSTTVERRTSSDGLRWGAPAATDLVQPGQVIWHIDVSWVAARNEYWAMYNAFPAGGSCATDALYLARSSDGVHWTTYPAPIVRRGIIPAFADIVYRSSFRVDAFSGTVTLWLSGATYAQSTGYTWRAAVVTRRIDDLIASAMTRLSMGTTTAQRHLPPPEPDVGDSN